MNALQLKIVGLALALATAIIVIVPLALATSAQEAPVPPPAAATATAAALTASPNATGTPTVAPSATPSAVPSAAATPCGLSASRLDPSKLLVGRTTTMSPALAGMTVTIAGPNVVAVDVAGTRLYLQGSGEVVGIIAPPGTPAELMTAIDKLVDEVRYAC